MIVISVLVVRKIAEGRKFYRLSKYDNECRSKSDVVYVLHMKQLTTCDVIYFPVPNIVSVT